MIKFILFLLLCSSLTSLEGKEKPYVSARIYGQLGNNLFQIATASALAWDNNAIPCFPDLRVSSAVFKHVFFRCKHKAPKKRISFEWSEPTYAYQPIPFHPNIRIVGYFQSEKYFGHHRAKLLELFAPHPKDLKYIQKKYKKILEHPLTVGVQIRYYKSEFPTGDMYPQYGKDYLEKAMAMFPESTLFVISSNNIDYVRKNMPKGIKNALFIENEPYYIDFFLLSMCKHNIISNSSFGWWSAWLNKTPNKIIIRPTVWMNGLPTQDVCPETWLKINAAYE